MIVSLQEEVSRNLGEILVHVNISKTDDGQFTFLDYSHSFKYKLPSGKNKEGEFVVYTNKDDAYYDANGISKSFTLAKCRDEDCKNEYPGGCPVIPDDDILHHVDIFHGKPEQEDLHRFGTALFDALFSGPAKELFQKTGTCLSHPDGWIFLQLNNHEALHAIPWEYAKDDSEFLIHQRCFTRIHNRDQHQLPKFSLRIIVVAPDPAILSDVHLPELQLGEQFQTFVKECKFDKKVTLERVFPPTVEKMNEMLQKYQATAAVLHFMGHCTLADSLRVLVFENTETGKPEFVDLEQIEIPKHLQLVFLSASNTREFAQALLERGALLEHGVPFIISSQSSIPNDLARKFESEFYKFLADGFTVDEAMHRARVSFKTENNIRQNDYFAGAMVLYSSMFREDANILECDDGNPIIRLHMPPNNLDIFSTTSTFYGRKKELSDLASGLRDMADLNQSYQAYTVKGIGGQGKTSLAIEVVRRVAYLFPGGIFAWPFDRKTISVAEYLRQLVDTIFPNEPRLIDPKASGDIDKLKNTVIKEFTLRQQPYLLILDHADTLSIAEARGQREAKELVAWLKEVTSNADTAVKILATSHDNLMWMKDEAISLRDLDVDSSSKLFNENLGTEVKKKMKIEANDNRMRLMHELVGRVNGHPQSLILLGRATRRTQHLDKQLKDIVRHCSGMIADEDAEKKELKKHCEPIIDTLDQQEQSVLYMCSLFSGPITPGVLLFVSYMIDSGKFSAKSDNDPSLAIITRSLQQLHHREILFEKEGEYWMHVGFREGVKQHNTIMKFQLHLPIPNIRDDTFLIGIPHEDGK